MKILRSYIRSGWYNITHNKMYALFYGLGTAITFIFVIILLQIAHLVTGTDAPFVNAKRTVFIESYFEDSEGGYIEGMPIPMANILLGKMPEHEMFSFSNSEWSHAIIGDKIRPADVNFVDGNYFIINQFDFVKGRAFTQEEMESRKQFAIVTKNFADRYLRGNDDKIEIQGINYTVLGVVKNYSSLLNMHEDANVWLPISFNTFIPSSRNSYSITLMFKDDVSTDAIRENTSKALNNYFQAIRKDKEYKPTDIKTIYEEKVDKLGGGKFAYGVAFIVFLLLFIPALNIMTLSMTNVQNRAKEVALRRAVGASKGESFLQILVENLILVMMGLITALLLLKPGTKLIERIFLQSTDSVTVLTDSGLSFMTIIFAILLAIAFSILCGGIPAWVISKKSISLTLKGGEQQ